MEEFLNEQPTVFRVPIAVSVEHFPIQQTPCNTRNSMQAPKNELNSFGKRNSHNYYSFTKKRVQMNLFLINCIKFNEKRVV